MIDDRRIGAALNRNLGSPTAPGEATEAELDRLIQRRSQQKDPEAESELWRESVRRYEEERRQMARLEWHAFHCGQAARHRAVLESLIAFHEERAARLCDDSEARGGGA